ncbi:MAG TPA: amidohydrolase [Synergistaceae bacterium]|nr:amidohydrolase [Synergistaceae bacterium]HPQ36604.1 amidohydrolase [Synergistaceae bacterium]
MTEQEKDLEKLLIRWRRDMHRFPESGWCEFRSTAKIAEELHGLGFRLYLGEQMVHRDFMYGRPPKKRIEWHRHRAQAQGANPKWLGMLQECTGVTGVLHTGRPGPVTAFRFDIDAVNISESESQEHKPFREGFASENSGLMHACAHDVHIALGVGLAHLLHRRKEELGGIVKIVFQPAEEGVRGGRAVAESGILDDADMLFAFHVGLGYPSGTLVPGVNNFLSTTKFDAIFKGRAAHAAVAPQEGANALLAAITAIQNLYTLSQHGGGVVRLNVGTLRAGEGRNVIPPSAEFEAECRGKTEEMNEYIYRRAEEIVKHAGAMHGVSCSLRKMGESVNASSDSSLVRLLQETAEESSWFTPLKGAIKGFGGSEDVTWLMKEVQKRGGRACYGILGADIVSGHHDGTFDVDEAVLLPGTELLFSLARKAWATWEKS